MAPGQQAAKVFIQPELQAGPTRQTWSEISFLFKVQFQGWDVVFQWWALNQEKIENRYRFSYVFKYFG